MKKLIVISGVLICILAILFIVIFYKQDTYTTTLNVRHPDQKNQIAESYFNPGVTSADVTSRILPSDKSITPSMVLNAPDQYLGRKVSIQGIAAPYIRGGITTFKGCDPSVKCCNDVGFGLSLTDGKTSLLVTGSNLESGPKINQLGYYEGAPVYCSGKDCAVLCKPLTYNRKYTVFGTIKKNAEKVLQVADYYIELESYQGR